MLSGRKQHKSQMQCLCQQDADQVMLWGPVEGHPNIFMSRTETCLNPGRSSCVCVFFVLFFYTRNKWKTVIASCTSRGRMMLNLSSHVYCMSHLITISCMSLNASSSPSANAFPWQSHSHPYTPKSLRLPELGATIKTVVALVTILKRHHLIGADTSNPAARFFS